LAVESLRIVRDKIVNAPPKTKRTPPKKFKIEGEKVKSCKLTIVELA